MPTIIWLLLIAVAFLLGFLLAAIVAGARERDNNNN